MNKFIALIATLFLFSCISKDNDTNYRDVNFEEKIKQLFVKNKQISDSISKVFDEEKGNRVLKVFFNRKENFLRLTIYQIFDFDEVKVTPENIVFEKKEVFLCYSGNELLESKKMNLDSLQKVFSNKNIFLFEKDNKFDEKSLTEKRLLQFDFYNWDKIEFNERDFYDFYGTQKRISFIKQ